MQIENNNNYNNPISSQDSTFFHNKNGLIASAIGINDNLNFTTKETKLNQNGIVETKSSNIFKGDKVDINNNNNNKPNGTINTSVNSNINKIQKHTSDLFLSDSEEELERQKRRALKQQQKTKVITSQGDVYNKCNSSENDTNEIIEEEDSVEDLTLRMPPGYYTTPNCCVTQYVKLNCQIM